MPLINARFFGNPGGKLPARIRLWTVLSLFSGFGVLLFLYAVQRKAFSDELLIYDAIWLDAWSLGFVLTLGFIWVSGLGWKSKAWLGILALSIFGVVEISVILDGTAFSSNAYWGDQKFRQAMILKFMTLGYPTDFYYKDLPVFYPPLLYLTFAAVTKILALPAFAAMKLGGMAIYLIGPIICYSLWRKLVSPVQAWLVVLFTFLTCSFPTPYQLSAPHAFVATVIFVPWWLRYVEGVGMPRPLLTDYLLGSLLGAVVATTYYYPFFVGATILVLRLLGIRGGDNFRWRNVVVVLGGSLLLSSWYWFPALWSVLDFGFDGAQGRWHHNDSTGVRLLYMAVSYEGILFLSGIVFSLVRIKKAVHRSLLLLLGSIIPLVMIGSVLGALDRPINLIKAREMVWVLTGPFIGLMAAGLLRRRTRSRLKWVVPVLAGIAMIVFVHQFNGYIKSKLVRTARTASIPSWHTDREEMAARAGSVFLSGQEELASFYPVYYFIALNEHYTNPASRMKARYDLLGILERLQDPYLFNLAMRTNRYDRVNYLMPRRTDSGYELTIGLSNYPNKWNTRTFSFDPGLLSNPSLFRPETGDNLFTVMEPDDVPGYPQEFWAGRTEDSLSTVMWLVLLRDHLIEAGRAQLTSYTGTDCSGWLRLLDEGEEVDLGDTIRVKDVRLLHEGDSVHMFFAVEATEPIKRGFRAALHLAGAEFHNFDFAVNPPTNTWTEWHTVVCRRTVPRVDSEFRLFFYFFDSFGALPGRVARDVRLADREGHSLP
jgi:hypothetical protein